MKFARGPRPWSVRLFAASLFCAALIGLVHGLANWPIEIGLFAERFGQVAWDYDRLVFALASEFSLVLFPILWICLFASSRARWVVTVFSIIKLVLIVRAAMFYHALRGFDPVIAAELALVCAALVLLFVRSTNRWIARQRGGQRVLT